MCIKTPIKKENPMKKNKHLLLVLLIATGCFKLLAQPTTSAPAPTAAASNVVSIFSDAYTNVPGTNLSPFWHVSQTTVYTPFLIGDTDNVIKYANMNYQGIQFGGSQDVSTMKYLHIDIWTADVNAATIPITLIWTGGERTITKTVATNGAWTSLNIPLSEFTGANLSSVIQFKFQSNEWHILGDASNPSKHTTVYLDNLYFWTDVAPALTVSTTNLTVNQAANSTSTFNIATSGSWTVASDQSWLVPSSASGSGNATITLTAQANATYTTRKANVTIVGSGITRKIEVTQNSLIPAPAATPTQNAANVKSIYSDSYTPAVTVTAFDNWWNMDFADVTFAPGNVGIVMSTTAAGNCGSPTFVGTPLNASDMTHIQVDVFPTKTMDIGLKLVTVANGESAGWVSLGTLTVNQWNRVSLPLTSFSMGSKTEIKQVGFATVNSFGSFFMDNLFFYNGTTSVKNTYQNEAVKVFPSVVTNNLSLNSNIEINRVIINSLTGQTMRTININAMEEKIDVSTLSAGNYFISIILENGESVTRKFIKQ
jgi:hypothetical protein